MHFQFLGTGNAAQIPCYGCHCIICERARQITNYRRLPCSARLQVNGQSILIDAGLPLLTERFPPGTINTILLTHYHMDHVQGLFHLRWGKHKKIPVIGPDDKVGCDDLFKHPGILDFLPAPIPFKPFMLLGIEITPLPLIHSKPTIGYLLKDDKTSIAYLTDTCGLPQKTTEFLQKQVLDVVVLDCSFPPGMQAYNHNSLTEALEIIDYLKPRIAYLTHISHQLDEFLLTNHYALPDNVTVATDNQRIDMQKLPISPQTREQQFLQRGEF